MPVPNMRGKDRFESVYRAEHFLDHLRRNKWDPGPLPDAVIFTYAGLDLLFTAQPDDYSMNPMLGTGPGRFFLANATNGRVGLSCMGIGAPAVAAQLEILAALGVRRFLSIGTAGGLGGDQVPGEVVVLTGAIRDEGTSYHYLDTNIDAVADPQLTAELSAAIAYAGIAATSGWSWTIDAPYRQTVEEIAEFRTRGVLTVEMEAAALFAVALARGVQMASAVVIDAVFGEPIGPPRMDAATAFGKLYDILLVGIDLLGAAAGGDESSSPAC